jgi:trans-aconitate methyltransferase
MVRWNAEAYHKNSSRQEEWARQALARLLLKGTERVLDIGCGDGKITAAIADRLPKGSILGVDQSADMISFAKKKFPPEKYPRLMFDVKEATGLTFTEEFDAIVSFSCLHWVQDHPAVLTGIRRSLKSGGRVLLHFGGKGNAAEMLDHLHGMLSLPKWRPYFTEFRLPWVFYSAEEYRPLVEASGLHLRRVELLAKPALMTPEDMKNWMRPTWLPYLQQCPETLREEFLEEVVRRFQKTHSADARGRMTLPMFRLEVEADKAFPAIIHRRG